MAKKSESRLQKRIQEALRKNVGGWWFKVWAGPFQLAGIPDIIGCCRGLFFAFEVKTPTGRASLIQVKTVSRIIKEGGGCAAFVTTPTEAVQIVQDRLFAAGRLPKRHS